ncbi:MAG: T9SS type A sorting domain-containing protein [bacterium]
MRKFLILFFLFSTSCFSQTLIWEREYPLSEPTCSSLLPTILDSDGNIITAYDTGQSPYYDAYIFKYNPDGNLILFKNYNFKKTLFPVALSQSENGYNILCATTNNSEKYLSGKLPLMLNVDNMGDTINSNIPFDVNNKVSLDTACFKINMGNINTISFDGSYYNATIKSSIKINDNTITTKDHLIITSYDLDGQIVWRKGIDTLNSDEFYGICSFKISKSKSIVLLCIKYINQKYNICILEFDKKGNIINRIEPIISEKTFFPIDIEKLNNNDYAIMGYYLTDKFPYALIRINSKGEILKNVDIPIRNSFISYENMWQSSYGNLLLSGKTILSDENGTGSNGINEMLLYQVDNDLNYISELQYCEHTDQNTSGFRNVKFIDDNNFVAVGYKDRYKFYIAKFSLKPSIVNDESTLQSQIEISPNPAGDFITVKMGTINPMLKHGVDENSEIKIYNTLGEKVMSESIHPMTASHRMNISALPKGMYFVKAGGEVAKFVKM